MNNNKEAVKEILKEPEVKAEQPVGEVPSLCHPLCNCPSCLRTTKSAFDLVLSRSHPTVASRNDLGMSGGFIGMSGGFIGMSGGFIGMSGWFIGILGGFIGILGGFIGMPGWFIGILGGFILVLCGFIGM